MRCLICTDGSGGGLTSVRVFSVRELAGMTAQLWAVHLDAWKAQGEAAITADM